MADEETLSDAVNKVLKVYVEDGKRPCGIFLNPPTRRRLSDELTRHEFYKMMILQQDTSGTVSRWVSPFGNMYLLEDKYMAKDEIAVVEIAMGKNVHLLLLPQEK